ncbi:MAG: hypothetical protein QXG58_04830 [Candidatus Bathyarchaeia archaeon]
MPKEHRIWREIKLGAFKANDEFHVKAARTKGEITELLEAGFEYVFTHEGLAYFRKRK